MNLKIQTGSCRATLRRSVAFSHGIAEAKEKKGRAVNQREYLADFFHRIIMIQNQSGCSLRAPSCEFSSFKTEYIYDKQYNL